MMKFTGLGDRIRTGRGNGSALYFLFTFVSFCLFVFSSHDNDFEAKLLVHHLASSRRHVDIVPHIDTDRRFVDGTRFDRVPTAVLVRR